MNKNNVSTDFNEINYNILLSSLEGPDFLQRKKEKVTDLQNMTLNPNQWVQPRKEQIKTKSYEEIKEGMENNPNGAKGVNPPIIFEPIYDTHNTKN